MWRRVLPGKAPFVFLALAIFIAVGGVLVVSPSTLAQSDVARDELKIVAQHDPVEAGPLSPVQKLALLQGYLVPDQRAYERAKAEAPQRAKSETATESSSAAS